MAPSSVSGAARTVLQLLLAIALVAHLWSLPSTSTSSAPGVFSLSSSSSNGTLDPTVAVRQLVFGKTTLLGLLLVRLPELLGGGESRSSKGAPPHAKSLAWGMGEVEKWGTLVGAAFWGVAHIDLVNLLRSERYHYSGTPIKHASHSAGAVVGLLLSLTLLHVCRVLRDDDDNGEVSGGVPSPVVLGTFGKARLPIIVITHADAIGDSQVAPDIQLEQGRKLLVEDSVLYGTLLGAALCVGVSAGWITSVLGYQPAALLLFPALLGVPLLSFPRLLSPPLLTVALTTMLLVWYAAAMYYTLDHRGAPTCGIWDPYTSVHIRSLERVLCHNARALHYLTWFTVVGLCLVLLDLQLALTAPELEEDRLPSASEVFSAASHALLRPIRPWVARPSKPRRGPIHLV